MYNENSKVCIFVKDPSADFKSLELKLPFTVKVISIEKLKRSYDRFADKRELVKNYDVFLCDTKISRVLKRFLGKPFFATKKYPLSISMDYTDKEGMVEKIVKAVQRQTVFCMGSGPNYSIKFSRVGQDTEEIVKNAVVVAKRVVPHILKFGVDYKELKSISLKTTDGVELPIFNQLNVEEILTFLDKI